MIFKVLIAFDLLQVKNTAIMKYSYKIELLCLIVDYFYFCRMLQTYRIINIDPKNLFVQAKNVRNYILRINAMYVVCTRSRTATAVLD